MVRPVAAASALPYVRVASAGRRPHRVAGVSSAVRVMVPVRSPGRRRTARTAGRRRSDVDVSPDGSRPSWSSTVVPEQVGQRGVAQVLEGQHAPAVGVAHVDVLLAVHPVAARRPRTPVNPCGRRSRGAWAVVMSTSRSITGWLTSWVRSSGSSWLSSTATTNGAEGRVVSETSSLPAPSLAPKRRSPSSWTSGSAWSSTGGRR